VSSPLKMSIEHLIRRLLFESTIVSIKKVRQRFLAMIFNLLTDLHFCTTGIRDFEGDKIAIRPFRAEFSPA
jgi:hypothetical protein